MKFTQQQLRDPNYFEAILDQLLDEQEKQGNPRNPEIFFKRPYEGKGGGGFYWGNTKYGHVYYSSFLYYDTEGPFFKWLLSAGKLKFKKTRKLYR